MLHREYDFIVILAGYLAGKGSRLDRDTIARIKEGLELYKKLVSEGRDPTIILSAGENRRKYPRQIVALATMMERAILKIDPTVSISVMGPAWGTRAELIAAANYGEQVYFWHRGRPVYHVVTSWYHKPRAEMLSREIFPEARVVSTAGSIINAIPEIWKLPAEWLAMSSPAADRILSLARGRT